MKFNDFCNRIKTDNAFARQSRILVMPNMTNQRDLLDFLGNSGLFSILRFSSCIEDNTFFPSPARAFLLLKEQLKELNAKGKTGVIIGFDGMMKLWNHACHQEAYSCIQELLDETKLQFLLFTAQWSDLAQQTFSHPRYESGQDILAIAETRSEDSPTTFTFVTKEFAELLEGQCIGSLQAVVKEIENGSLQPGQVNVVVDYFNHDLAGINENIGQVFTKKGFLEQYCQLNDALSEDAIQFLYNLIHESGKIQNALAFVQRHYCPNGASLCLEKLPQVIRKSSIIEQELLLWMLRNSLSGNTYLGEIIKNREVTGQNFTKNYVCGAVNLLHHPLMEKFAKERKDGIAEIGVQLLDGQIMQFITDCKNVPFDQVVPWLNNDTIYEKREIVRRLMKSEAVELPIAIKKVYPLLEDYMQPYSLPNREISQYFQNYRKFKLKNQVPDEFCQKAQNIQYPPKDFFSRDEMLQKYSNQTDTALLVVDALGAEYMPLLLALAKHRELDIEFSCACYAKLPTSTLFNSISWPAERRLNELKSFDNAVHDGVEKYEVHEYHENLVELLETISTNIMIEIEKAMTDYKRVILTSDHGASRLAICAYENGHTHTLTVAEGASIDDWRYVSSANIMKQPSNTLESLDGRFYIVKGYDRLPKAGGKYHELHGGLTYEEMLVPFIVFCKGAQPVPAKPEETNTPEIVENSDFDL